MIYSKNYQDAAVQAQFESLWQCIWQKLFCSKTNLFYDTLPGNDLIENLPLPEEIALQVPNPCGWGTGMEDSMLNAGNMLLASLNRYDSEADERFAEQARKVFAGMALCASVGKSHGYLARSVSPFDCKSYYINSSRDQYTHFVYSAYIYYNHKLCSGNDRALIKKFLTDFADGLTMSSYLRKNGLEKWGNIPVEVYDSFRDQFMETLKNAKMPKFLMMPESVDAVEEEICNWVAIDEAVNERGLKSKCDTRGFDEELSFSLPAFLKMIRRDVVRVRKGELDRLSKMLPTENIRKLAKAYK